MSRPEPKKVATWPPYLTRSVEDQIRESKRELEAAAKPEPNLSDPKPNSIDGLFDKIRGSSPLVMASLTSRYKLTTSQEGYDSLVKLAYQRNRRDMAVGGKFCGLDVLINPEHHKRTGIRSLRRYCQFEMSDAWAVWAGMAEWVYTDEVYLMDMKPMQDLWDKAFNFQNLFG